MKILLQKSRILLLERGREQGRDKAAFQRKDTDCSIQVRGTLMNELMLYDSKEKKSFVRDRYCMWPEPCRYKTTAV